MASETMHTAGPWCLDGHNMATVLRCVRERGHPEAKHLTGDYEVIARCEGENWRANARSISALPAILDVLGCVEEYLDQRADADGDVSGFISNEEMRLLIEVRAALAVATRPSL